MHAHPVFTAMSEDVTALGAPAPGELIWVGFSNIGNQSYPYYAARVASKRQLNVINPSTAQTSGVPGQPGQSMGTFNRQVAQNVAQHIRSFTELMPAKSTKYGRTTQGLINLLQHYSKTASDMLRGTHGGTLKTASKGVIEPDDVRYTFANALILNMVKTMGDGNSPNVP